MTTSQDIRFASFNASLNRNEAGQLISDLSTKTNTQARNIAEIIQRTNPDVILINEFDYDPDAKAAQLFQQNYLAVGQNGANPIEYPYYYVAPSNTGVSSGFDLDNDGTIGGPNDALGFGFFPGQYGMVLYSKHPIDEENIRTFQKFLWKDMPNALLPDDWYSPEELEVFRLSSKSHWDIPIQVNGETIHVLASHPTPPVFDGEEDRNGRRNHDEIRFWSDYFTPGQGNYIYDDAGKFGGLAAGSHFVVMGDQNADPFDGDSTNNAIWQLLGNPLINTRITPNSEGGVDAAIRQGGANDDHISDPAYDTADFADTTPGNLRVDYVLPSQNLEITDASVFWKTSDDPLFRLVGDFDPNLASVPSSDHRLVAADVRLTPAIAIPDVSQKSVVDLDFIGEVTFDTGLTFQETEVGGLSGIVYDPAKNLFYSISDDRSSINPARFYTLKIDLTDGKLQPGDIKFQNVTTLLDENGQLFAENSLDPEGITLTNQGTLFISSEGDTNQFISPFVNQFSIRGQQFQALPVPPKYLPTRNQTSGIRNNLAFESLTITPNNKYLYTATENALIQDGYTADLENGSPSRILQYNVSTGMQREFLYVTDPVAAESVPPGEFQTNGLVDLLAIDNNGTLLALERSFSTGVGNTIKLYEVQTQNAVDIRSIPSVDGLEIAPVQKRLLLDFAELETPLDNIEGISFGPLLPDGRQSLVVVSDNNFSDTQFTQFLAFAVDLDTTPGAVPTVETPPVVDSDAPVNSPPGDADDPAIYVHPVDSALSLVIGSLKDGGLAVYDLEGKQLQTILPGEPGDVRYNNVDLLYGFKLGDRCVDLAIASDRNNDTLAIFQIDPTTRQLKDITASSIPASIFGIDDGEQTAYGLATYTSSSGKSYVFVSQRESNQVAQLELIDNGFGKVTAKTVRTLTLPIPDGGELADAQIEGMVADRELGYLYVGQEKVGIWKFAAEVTGKDEGVLVDAVKPEGSNLTADVEGLTIYYAGDGKGYLLASSQGDNTFAVYSREGNNEYLGSFVVGEFQSIDGVQESDGADVINAPLGANFPKGMLVLQDGNNDPAVIVEDEGELENASSNFKFIPWENVANAFADALTIDPSSYNPRESSVKEITGTPANDNLVGTHQRDNINGLVGNDTITGALNHDLLTGGGDRDFFIVNQGDGTDTITDFQGVGTGKQPITTAVDTIQFLGAELTARNMLLTQQNDDLLIHFESDDSPQVILQNFDLENLENLKIGNLLFNSQSEIQDNFDVFDANAQRDRIFNPNSVTFLNDLDNRVKGYNYSHDVINSQGGNDRIFGLSGDDLLRGGRGNDTLSGGLGEDTITGDSGSDVFVLNDAGFDIISDFNLNHGDRIGLTHNLTFEQLAIKQGAGSNVNNTILSVSGEEIAILMNVTASSLMPSHFIFV